MATIKALTGTVAALLLLLFAWAPAQAAKGCDFCGMSIARYAETLHRITLSDGQQRTYCSFACLSRALVEIPPAAVRAVEAADYGTSAFGDATRATYVEGSSARPVMSRVSMVAFAMRGDAEAFAKAKGGKVMDYAAALASERRREGLPSPAAAAVPPPPPPMPKPGKKVVVNDDYWFTYSFDKRPSMGTVVLRVELFDKGNRPVTSLAVTGEADMPSMRGAHSSGAREFKLNKKGVYLLPVDIVMPGGWEVIISIVKDGKVLFRGSHAFSI